MGGIEMREQGAIVPCVHAAMADLLSTLFKQKTP